MLILNIMPTFEEKQPFFIKFTTVFTFFLLFVSRMANITHPLILKAIIDNISCDPDEQDCPESDEVYVLIGAYAGVKFGADFLNFISLRKLAIPKM